MIRRDPKSQLCDFWHRIKWGIVMATLIFGTRMALHQMGVGI